MHNSDESYSKKLKDISPKAARAFQTIGEELGRELSEEQFQIWFNLGFLISYASSANGIKYFNESGTVVRKISSDPSFVPLLQTAIPLAFAQNSIAMDYFCRLPALIHSGSAEVIAQWAEIGKRIATEDYLAGSEYIKSGPDILPVFDLNLLEPWGKIGVLLSQEDQRNKSFLALEYFRTTPDIFRQIKDHSLFSRILSIGHALALQTPKQTVRYFGEIPGIFRNLKESEGINLIFALTAELSFHAPFAVIDFLAHATDMLKMMDGNLTSLKTFVETGLQMNSNPDSIKSFFCLKSKKSIELIQELSHTVFLADISKRMTYYAEMITGRRIEITPGTAPSSSLKNGYGRIVLPEKINAYRKRDDNDQLYKMLLLHEAAHIEFGSYDSLSDSDLEPLRTLFPSEGFAIERVQTLWKYFPDPVLAQNLWTIAEESRIDFLLRTEYPGAVNSFRPILNSQKGNRPDLFQLPEEKAVIEALFQLSIHEEIVVPLSIANTVSRNFAILKRLWHPKSSIQETLHTVCLMYQQLHLEFKSDVFQDKNPEILPFEENALRYGTIPKSSFSHHGLINPELAFQIDSTPMSSSSHPRASENETVTPNQGEPVKTKIEDGPSSASRFTDTAANHELGSVYPEWDWMSRDYKPGWCRVIEKKVEPTEKPPKDSDFPVRHLLSLRRYFEKLRPENYRKSRKQKDGEEFDFDQLTDLIVDLRAGISPSEKFYIRREKRERKISVSFLVDLSGSTRQIIPGTQKRIIDIEKESLKLMAEVLDTIGDDYGIYGFSGKSRHEVDFYSIKDFDDRNSPAMNDKIGSLEPLVQNRDGAAIRHLIEKLYRREAKTKILIILSDGKPLDEEYTDLYALEDTKMALREAKHKGIHPYCITVDRQANEYIKKMYQEVNYTYISDIQTLPLKLPQIYKKITRS